MAKPGYIGEDVQFAGNVAFLKSVSLPSGSVNNADIVAGANIADTKINHRRQYDLAQDLGTVSTTQAKAFPIYNTQTILGVLVQIAVVPTGDHTVVVDVKKSTGGGAFASILSSAYTINSTSTALTVYYPALSGSPSLAAGDILELSITAAGSTSTQGQGATLSVVVAENGT